MSKNNPGMNVLMRHVLATELDMDTFDTEMDAVAEYQKDVRESIDYYYAGIES